MTTEQKKLFEDAGLKSDDWAGILSLILAAPDAVSKTLGTDGAVRVAVEATVNMPKDKVSEMLNFKSIPYGLGALVPPAGAPVTKNVVPAKDINK